MKVNQIQARVISSEYSHKNKEARITIRVPGEDYIEYIFGKESSYILPNVSKPQQAMSNSVKKKFADIEDKLFEIQKMLAPVSGKEMREMFDRIESKK